MAECKLTVDELRRWLLYNPKTAERYVILDIAYPNHNFTENKIDLNINNNIMMMYEWSCHHFIAWYSGSEGSQYIPDHGDPDKWACEIITAIAESIKDDLKGHMYHYEKVSPGLTDRVMRAAAIYENAKARLKAGYLAEVERVKTAMKDSSLRMMFPENLSRFVYRMSQYRDEMTPIYDVVETVSPDIKLKNRLKQEALPYCMYLVFDALRLDLILWYSGAKGIVYIPNHNDPERWFRDVMRCFAEAVTKDMSDGNAGYYYSKTHMRPVKKERAAAVFKDMVPRLMQLYDNKSEDQLHILRTKLLNPEKGVMEKTIDAEHLSEWTINASTETKERIRYLYEKICIEVLRWYSTDGGKYISDGDNFGEWYSTPNRGIRQALHCDVAFNRKFYASHKYTDNALKQRVKTMSDCAISYIVKE